MIQWRSKIFNGTSEYGKAGARGRHRTGSKVQPDQKSDIEIITERILGGEILTPKNGFGPESAEIIMRSKRQRGSYQMPHYNKESSIPINLNI